MPSLNPRKPGRVLKASCLLSIRVLKSLVCVLSLNPTVGMAFCTFSLAVCKCVCSLPWGACTGSQPWGMGVCACDKWHIGDAQHHLGRPKGKASPEACWWASWWVCKVISSIHVPLMPLQTLGCYSPNPPHHAATVFWMEQEIIEPLWQCSAQLGEPGIYSHTFIFLHGRNNELKKSFLALSSATSGERSCG